MFIIMIFQTVMFFFLDGWSPPLFNIGKRGKTVIIIITIITFLESHAMIFVLFGGLIGVAVGYFILEK